MTEYKMAGGYKSKYKRKYARKGRVAKIAKGKVTSVQALAKAVKSIQRSLRTKVEYLNYTQSDVVSITNPAQQISLSQYAGWNDTFGTSSNDDTPNRVIHKSFGMDVYISLENTVNEPDTTQFTCMLISLKDDIGQYYSPSSGYVTWTTGATHVVRGGLVLLNKKMFKIHKTKRFVLSNHGSSLANPSAQTQSGTDKRFYMKFSPNCMVTNSAGDWKSLQGNPDPSKQYFFVVFNDNSNLDLQNPQITYNVVHTVQTVA